MHFNLEVNYLLDPAHLEIRASCEKRQSPKKHFERRLIVLEFQMQIFRIFPWAI